MDEAGGARVARGLGLAGAVQAVEDAQHIVRHEAAVVALQDHVVDVDEAENLGGDAGFLVDFAERGIASQFAGFDVAAGQTPQALHSALAAFDNQDAGVVDVGVQDVGVIDAGAMEYDRACRRPGPMLVGGCVHIDRPIGFARSDPGKVSMPSRYCLTSTPERVQAHFGYDDPHVFPPRTDIVPTEPVLVVRRWHDGRRVGQLMRWGLIPGWARDLEKIGTLATARFETIGEKASFRGPLRHKRCLFPADGVYVGKRGKRCLAQSSDGGLLAIAGLYEDWMGADGSEIDSAAIITAAARGEVARYGARMPAVIAAGAFDAWLDCRGTTASEALEFVSSPADFSVTPIDDD